MTESWGHTMSSRPVLVRAMEFHALVVDQMGSSHTDPNGRSEACAALVTLAAAGLIDITAREDFMRLCGWCWEIAEELKTLSDEPEQAP